MRRPYGLWVHGNNDTAGAVSAVEKLATGLSLTKAAAALGGRLVSGRCYLTSRLA